MYPNVRKNNKKGCLEKWQAKDLDLIADKVMVSSTNSIIPDLWPVPIIS